MSTDNQKETGTLYTELLASTDLDRFLNDNRDTVCDRKEGEVLREFLNQYSCSKAEVARRSGISDVYLYQIMAGKRRASRDKLITMCVVLGASLPDTQQLLKNCGEKELYAKSRRDAVLIKGISSRLNLVEINALLVKAEEPKL